VPEVVRLQPPLAERVAALLDEAETVDGARALSEHAELALHGAGATPSDGFVHIGVESPHGVTGQDGAALLAYAQVDMTGDGPISVEGVIHPAHRRGGVGAAVAVAVLRAAGGRGVLAWAHGDQPGATALAARLGARRVRELLQMRRPLPVALPEPALPAGLRLRAFRPGQDDEAWLAVNARAFAAHAEQGAWTRTDLDARMAEPWFDPEGFLLAEDEATGDLLGFHWTKVHPATGAHPQTGEVYVLGVDPPAQGRKLASALTLAGLHHLGRRGLSAVLLYVEADNDAALRVYRGMGFEVAAVDVRYALP